MTHEPPHGLHDPRSEDSAAGQTTAASREEDLVVPAMTVRAWDLWERPFARTTENLDTFLLFLTDEAAKRYEIARLTSYSLTLRLEGPEESTVLYTTSSIRTGRDERYALYETLQTFPKKMPRHLREKLSAHIGWFFTLKELQA